MTDSTRDNAEDEIKEQAAFVSAHEDVEGVLDILAQLSLRI